LSNQTVSNVSDEGNPVPDEVKSKPPTFTPLKIGADGGRVPYDNPPSFDQLRADLLGGTAVVVMDNVDMREIEAKHSREGDPTAGYDGGQCELVDLLDSALSTDPDIASLWIDAWGGDAEGLESGYTANGEPCLAGSQIWDFWRETKQLPLMTSFS
jgi:hypothetical protein